jgi:HEAT repeat protein
MLNRRMVGPGAVALITLLISCSSPSTRTAKEVEGLIEEKKIGEATTILRKALRENPKNEALLCAQINLFLQTDQPVYALATYRTLKEANPKTDYLAQAITEGNTVVRVNAAKALGLLRDTESVRALVEASDDPEQQVRQAVVLALGDLQSSDGIPALIKSLRDEDWFVRAEAATALGKVGNVNSVPLLFPLLNDKDTYVRNSARKALIELATPENESAYLEALRSEDPLTARMGAIALAHIGNTAGLSILLEELETPSTSDTIKVIEAIVLLKSKEALPALRKAARHDDIETSLPAVLALGRLLDGESEAFLKKLSTQSGTDIRLKRAALVSLTRIQNAP